MSKTVSQTLQGSRVTLVPMNLDFVDAITEVFQDARISETTTVPHPYTRDMAVEHLSRSEESWKNGNADWAILSAKNQRFLGRLEFWRGQRDPKSAEVGYFIRTDAWGEGFMTEALGLAVDFAFDQMDVTRIDWYCHVENWGSWKPAWRNGFKREGIRRRAEGPDLWQASLLITDTREPKTPWDGPGAGQGPALDPSRPGKLVEQFHRTYSMPVRLGTGALPTIDYERLNMRMSLIREEFAELMGAVYGPAARSLVEEATEKAVDGDDHTRDLIETADALADLVYVIYGMAIESGIDLDAVLAEVQASNLSKLMPDGSVKLREDGKVLKGPNFFVPNIARALGVDQG